MVLWAKTLPQCTSIGKGLLFQIQLVPPDWSNKTSLTVYCCRTTLYYDVFLLIWIILLLWMLFLYFSVLTFIVYSVCTSVCYSINILFIIELDVPSRYCWKENVAGLCIVMCLLSEPSGKCLPLFFLVQNMKKTYILYISLCIEYLWVSFILYCLCNIVSQCEQ